MACVFDKPQWKWVKDEESREYGGIPNLVEISYEGGRDLFHVPVVIPTELFKFLQDMGIKQVDALYMEHQHGRWIFGIEMEEDILDLWYYTPSTRPMWSMEQNKV